MSHPGIVAIVFAEMMPRGCSVWVQSPFVSLSAVMFPQIPSVPGSFSLVRRQTVTATLRSRASSDVYVRLRRVKFPTKFRTLFPAAMIPSRLLRREKTVRPSSLYATGFLQRFYLPARTLFTAAAFRRGRRCPGVSLLKRSWLYGVQILDCVCGGLFTTRFGRSACNGLTFLLVPRRRG